MQISEDDDEHQGQKYHLELEQGYEYLMRIKDFQDNTWLECNYCVGLRNLKDFSQYLILELNFHIFKNCLPEVPDFEYEYILADIEYNF